MTPLIAASCHGHLEAAVLLMEAGADPAVTMTVSGIGALCTRTHSSTRPALQGQRTALHWAAHNGHANIIALLLADEANVDPNAVDVRAFSVLAAEAG